MRKIIVLKDFIVLQYPKPKKIILAQKKDAQGYPITMLDVILVGEACKYVKVGDRIVCDGQNAALPFEHEDTLYYLTKEDCVGAILRKEDLDIPEKV